MSADDGFSIVEVIIAMFLLAIIATAILPMLLQGIRYSAQQSAVATATRQLSATIDTVRANATCATVGSILGARSYADGSGRSFTVDTSVSPGISTCSENTTVTLTLVASNSGTSLARATALVYLP
ncbi:hypothetical protein GCM10022240_29040 [Microbacterium kribbense]|uniref:Prepilin-type N-terminal cleavage/methylation domain-containing protein n=1 Tax=Microbacterium kribbense TaxID=433645 RepID=A0ABP7GX56_9MICO